MKSIVQRAGFVLFVVGEILATLATVVSKWLRYTNEVVVLFRLTTLIGLVNLAGTAKHANNCASLIGTFHELNRSFLILTSPLIIELKIMLLSCLYKGYPNDLR